MKTRQKNIIAIVAVLLIWGYAGLKFFDFMDASAEEEMMVDLPRTNQAIQYQNKQYTLQLDYTDPFLKRKPRRRAASTTTNTTRPTNSRPTNNPNVNTPPATVKWPSVVCNGKMKSEGSKDYRVLIQIDGQSFILKKGDIAKGCQLLNVMDKSIELQYNGETKTFSF